MAYTTLHAPTADLEGRPQPYQRLDAPVTAFGAREAQAVQQAVDVGVQFKNLADESDANDALNEFRSDNMKAGGDFLNKQGKDAVDAHGSYVADLNARKERIMGRLSFGAQRLAKQHIEGVFNHALESGDNHFRQQQRKWSVESSNATLDLNIKNAIEARNDPVKLQQLLEHGDSEYDKMRPILGWDEATTANHKANWFTRFYGSVIAKKAAEDPIGAQKLLDSVGGKLDPELRDKLSGYLKPRIDRLVVDTQLNKLMKTSGSDGKPLGGQAFIDAAGKLFPDPQRNFLSMTRARQMVAKDEQKNSQQTEEMRNHISHLEKLLKSGDVSLPIPEKEIERLFPTDASNIIGSLKISRMSGQMLKGLATMTEQELAALYKDVESGIGKYSDEVRTYLGSRARATAPIAPRDFSGQFNTQLTPELENEFEIWSVKNAGRLKRDLGKDLDNYDLRGHFLKVNGADLDGNYQLNNFKKPNHPTFSNASIYHKGDFQGGEWIIGQDGKNTFIPSPTNIENLGDAGLQDHFKRQYPDAALHLPSPTRSDFELAKEKLVLRQLYDQARELHGMRNTALRADGMGYAIANDPMTRAAFAKAQQTGDARDWSDAIGLGGNFLRRLGVGNSPPLPQVMLNGMAGDFASGATPAAKLKAVQAITMMGDDVTKRAVIQQLVDAGVPRSLPYILQAAGRKDLHGAYSLIEASKVAPSPDLESHVKLLKEAPDAAPHFTVYDLASIWTNNQEHRKRGMEEATLVANMVRNGGTAAGAIRAVMGDQKPLIDRNLAAAFIPKTVDQWQALDGFDRLRQELITPDNWNFVTQIAGDDKDKLNSAIADTTVAERKKARWISYSDGTVKGYALVLSTGGLLPAGNGKPLVVTIDQVLEAGKQAPNRIYFSSSLLAAYDSKYGYAVDLSGYGLDGRPR